MSVEQAVQQWLDAGASKLFEDPAEGMTVSKCHAAFLEYVDVMGIEIVERGPSLMAKCLCEKYKLTVRTDRPSLYLAKLDHV